MDGSGQRGDRAERRAAALAVQRVIAEDHLLENVQAMGARLEQRLLERFGNHRHIGDIRGRGLFWAVEFVADRTSKAVFDPALPARLWRRHELVAGHALGGDGSGEGVRLRRSQAGQLAVTQQSHGRPPQERLARSGISRNARITCQSWLRV